MARAKRSSNILEESNKRMAALKSIDTNLDLGNGLNIAALNDRINEAQKKLDAHNDALSHADATGTDLKAEEKRLLQFTQRMIAGVAAKYSKDSLEYEKAGFTRPSDIKRTGNKPTKADKKE